MFLLVYNSLRQASVLNCEKCVFFISLHLSFFTPSYGLNIFSYFFLLPTKTFSLSHRRFLKGDTLSGSVIKKEVSRPKRFLAAFLLLILSQFEIPGDGFRQAATENRVYVNVSS
jgi:hypothetical protein